jgi:hypothetical protein
MGLNMTIQKRTKTKFDLTDGGHLSIYKSFLETNSWGRDGCPFEVEFPYLNVPDMIKDKIVYNLLGVTK